MAILSTDEEVWMDSLGVMTDEPDGITIYCSDHDGHEWEEKVSFEDLVAYMNKDTIQNLRRAVEARIQKLSH